MKVLVTGASGFLGSYTSAHFSRKGDEVIGTYLEHDHPPVGCPGWEGVSKRQLDVRNGEDVRSLIERELPDVIFHFSGQAYVQRSFQEPELTHAINYMGTLHILEATRRSSPHTKVIFAGSGTEYGEPSEIPTPESSPLAPTSPYAASKAAAELLCQQHALAHGTQVFRLRIFGTTGVGKKGDFCNDVASRVADAERSGGGVVKVGRLDVRRDIVDVSDFVRAAEVILDHGDAGRPYNVGSGQAYLVSDLLQLILGLSRAEIAVAHEKGLLRDSDEPIHLGAISNLRALGYRPTVPIKQTLENILNWHRERLSASPGDHAPP